MSLAIVIFYLAAFTLGGAGMYRANRAVAPARRRERWLKFATYFAITAAVLVIASWGPAPFTALAAVILALGARELYQVRRGLPVAVWIAYAALGAGLLLFARDAPPSRVIFVYLIVAVFDGFSQVSGQLYGRRQLAARISPAKTLEGAAGGLFAAALTAILLRALISATPIGAVALCLPLAAAAFAGDLAASGIKRRQAIKDFGTLLPGHGGILDRFDSFLPAAALAWLIF
jgi:phosphatidate cytidylyltransferase